MPAAPRPDTFADPDAIMRLAAELHGQAHRLPAGAPLPPDVPNVPYAHSLPNVPRMPLAPHVAQFASSSDADFYFLPDRAMQHAAGIHPDMDVPAPAANWDVHAVRRDFPILNQRVNGKPLIWLDNAATSQKPLQVIQAVERFYRDVRLFRLYEGTSQIQQIIIARNMIRDAS